MLCHIHICLNCPFKKFHQKYTYVFYMMKLYKCLLVIITLQYDHIITTCACSDCFIMWCVKRLQFLLHSHTFSYQVFPLIMGLGKTKVNTEYNSFLLKNMKHFNTVIHNMTCFHCTIFLTVLHRTTCSALSWV